MGGKSSKQKEKNVIPLPPPAQPRPDPRPPVNVLNQIGLPSELSVRPRTQYVTRIPTTEIRDERKVERNMGGKSSKQEEKNVIPLPPPAQPRPDPRPPVNVLNQIGLPSEPSVRPRTQYVTRIPPTEIRDERNEWNCLTCTFRNSGVMIICEMCTTPKPPLSSTSVSLTPPVEPEIDVLRETNDTPSTTDTSDDLGVPVNQTVTLKDHNELTSQEEDHEEDTKCQDSDEVDKEPLAQRFKKLLEDVAKQDLPRYSTETLALDNTELHFHIGGKNEVESDKTEQIYISNNNICPISVENAIILNLCDHIEKEEIQVEIDVKSKKSVPDKTTVTEAKEKFSNIDESTDDNNQKGYGIQINEDDNLCKEVKNEDVKQNKYVTDKEANKEYNNFDDLPDDKYHKSRSRIQINHKDIITIDDEISITYSIQNIDYDHQETDKENLISRLKLNKDQDEVDKEDLSLSLKVVSDPEVNLTERKAGNSINSHENVKIEYELMLLHKDKFEDDRTNKKVQSIDIDNKTDKIQEHREVKQDQKTETIIKYDNQEKRQNNQKKKRRRSKKKISNVDVIEDSEKKMDETQSFENSNRNVNKITIDFNEHDAHHCNSNDLINSKLEYNEKLLGNSKSNINIVTNDEKDQCKKDGKNKGKSKQNQKVHEGKSTQDHVQSNFLNINQQLRPVNQDQLHGKYQNWERNPHQWQDHQLPWQSSQKEWLRNQQQWQENHPQWQGRHLLGQENHPQWHGDHQWGLGNQQEWSRNPQQWQENHPQWQDDHQWRQRNQQQCQNNYLQWQGNHQWWQDNQQQLQGNQQKCREHQPQWRDNQHQWPENQQQGKGNQHQRTRNRQLCLSNKIPINIDNPDNMIQPRHKSNNIQYKFNAKEISKQNINSNYFTDSLIDSSGENSSFNENIGKQDEIDNQRKLAEIDSLLENVETLKENFNYQNIRSVNKRMSVDDRNKDKNSKCKKTLVIVSMENSSIKPDYVTDYFSELLSPKMKFNIHKILQGDNISNGEVHLTVQSKNMASQIIDEIRKSKIPGMKAKLLPEGQEMAREDMKAYIAEQIKDMQIKADMHIAGHFTKIEEVERELNVISGRKNLTLQEFEKLKEGKPALQNKKEELQLQMEEFQYFMDGLKQKLENIKVNERVKDVVREIRNAFGWECNRLHKALPMYARRRDVISTVNDNQVSIILGETGSGKSTQIAQYLYQVGYSNHGAIVCTQPRKVAAISLAHHVAQELGSHVGQVVGYQVGMQAKKNKDTGVVFVTDHILLNECLKDSMFSKYSCIIIDEAHERSIYTDLLLGMIKKCLAVRNDLKVIITSATIDPEVFVRYFNNCPVLKVSGRMFPVDVIWRSNEQPLVNENNYLSETVAKAKEVHKSQPKGDILVFLTTPLDTERACKMLESDSTIASEISCLQLHGRLQSNEQQKVFDPPAHGKRKVVFATNSAETSITITGIKYVIDSGLTKEMRFDPKRNISVLMVRKINKSSAEQRKGRAGRVESGKCFRLFTKDEYEQLEPMTLPEILRVNLAKAMLKLMELGVSNIEEFDFVESPSSLAISEAKQVLNEVGAITDGHLSDTGKKMAKLPLEPRLAKIVLRGLELDLGFEAIVIAAICSVSSNLFFRIGTMEEKQRADKLKTRFCEINGDVLTLLNVFKEWNDVDESRKSKWCQDNSINAKSMRVARDTIADLKTTLAKDLNIQVEFKFKDTSLINDELPRLLLETFPSNLGYFSGHEKAGYFLGRDETSVHLHPGSALYVVANFPQWIVFEEVLKLSQDYMLNATPVKEEWVYEMIKSGKVKLNINSLKNKVIKPISIKNIGPYIMKKKIIGAKFSTLKELEGQMKKCWPDSLLYLEPKVDEGLLQVFISSQYHRYVKEVFEKLLVQEKKALRKECLEKPILPNFYCKVRSVVEHGGITGYVLMPDEFRSIIVCSVSTDTNDQELLQRFKPFGNIEDYFVFDKKKSPKKWGKIIYQKPECAKSAFNALNSDKLSLQIDGRPVSDQTGQELKTRVLWCRRPLKGFVFVEFRDPEDLSMVYASARQILINGRLGKVSRSKKNDDELFITGIGSFYTEEHIKEAINLINPALGDFKIKMPRNSEPLPSKEQMVAYKSQLQMKISRYAQNSSFHIELLEPRNEKDFNMVAFVKFNDINIGMEVINALDQIEEIAGSVLSITPELKASF